MAASKQELNLKKKRWTIEEANYLGEHYPVIGVFGCSIHLGRSDDAVFNKASRLGLKCPTRYRMGKPRRKIIMNGEKFVIATCPCHGDVKHRKYMTRLVCLVCEKEWSRRRKPQGSRTEYMREYMRKRRSTMIGKITNRLRVSLSRYVKGKASFLRDLPYTAKELKEHLEEIRKQQNNRCPLCGGNYDKVGFNIDHRVPLSLAKSEEELLNLFSLENLTLLCPYCNQVKKGARLFNQEIFNRLEHPQFLPPMNGVGILEVI